MTLKEVVDAINKMRPRKILVSLDNSDKYGHWFYTRTDKIPKFVDKYRVSDCEVVGIDMVRGEFIKLILDCKVQDELETCVWWYEDKN